MLNGAAHAARTGPESGESARLLQPLEEIAQLAHEHDSLFVLDAVTSLGGAPVQVDELAIDACYSGTQKCLSCPPGLSPVTFNERALDAVRKRKTKVQSWYLDLSMIEKYWGERACLSPHGAHLHELCLA